MLFEFFKFGLFCYTLKRVGACLVNASKLVLMVPVCFVKKVCLFLSYIINLFSQTKGKRGELRYGDILPASKFSSSCMVLKYLSSRVLLFRLFGRLCSGLSFFSKSCSDLFRVFMALNNHWLTPAGIRQVQKSSSACAQSSFPYLVMTLVGIVFSLFLLFPNTSNAKICFLPDCDLAEDPQAVSIDSSQCELAGYTYYSSGTYSIRSAG